MPVFWFQSFVDAILKILKERLNPEAFSANSHIAIHFVAPLATSLCAVLAVAVTVHYAFSKQSYFEIFTILALILLKFLAYYIGNMFLHDCEKTLEASQTRLPSSNVLNACSILVIITITLLSLIFLAYLFNIIPENIDKQIDNTLLVSLIDQSWAIIAFIGLIYLLIDVLTLLLNGRLLGITYSTTANSAEVFATISTLLLRITLALSPILFAAAAFTGLVYVGDAAYSYYLDKSQPISLFYFYIGFTCLGLVAPLINFIVFNTTNWFFALIINLSSNTRG